MSYSFGDQTNPIAAGLIALATPLAQAGMQIGVTAQKTEVNQNRIKMGKAPCTGMVGQPFDCPQMFAPLAMVGSEVPPESSEGESMLPMIFILGAAGLIAFLFFGGKKSPTSTPS